MANDGQITGWPVARCRLLPPPVDGRWIPLNGLYSVLIEKEPAADTEAIFTGVQKLLSAHRNL